MILDMQKRQKQKQQQTPARVTLPQTDAIDAAYATRGAIRVTTKQELPK